jgi:hypothetical protein
MSTTAENLTNTVQKQAEQVARKLSKSSRRVHKSAQKNIKRYGGRLQKDARRLRKAANQNYGKLNSHQKLGLIAGLALIVAAFGALIGRASAKPTEESKED